MTAAGFLDLQRGERGSAAEHLAVEEYKYQREKERAEEMAAIAESKEKEASAMLTKVEQNKSKISKLDEQITVKEKAKATLKEVDAMGHPLPLVPGVHLSDDEAKRLKALARKSVGIDKRAEEYKAKIEALDGSIRNLNSQIESLKHDIRSIARDRDTWKANYERLWAEVKDFIGAIRTIPNRLRTLIAEHLPKTQNKERSYEISH